MYMLNAAEPKTKQKLLALAFLDPAQISALLKVNGKGFDSLAADKSETKEKKKKLACLELNNVTFLLDRVTVFQV